MVFPYFGLSLDDFIKGKKKRTDKRSYTIDSFVHIFHQIASALF